MCQLDCQNSARVADWMSEGECAAHRVEIAVWNLHLAVRSGVEMTTSVPFSAMCCASFHCRVGECARSLIVAWDGRSDRCRATSDGTAHTPSDYKDSMT